jgi:hypothetical protein
MTILRQDGDHPVSVERHDCAGSRMMNDGKIDRDTIGQGGSLDPEIDNAEL